MVIVTSCRIFGQAALENKQMTVESRVDAAAGWDWIGIRIREPPSSACFWLLVTGGGGGSLRHRTPGPRQMSLVYSCLISILGPRKCCDR